MGSHSICVKADRPIPSPKIYEENVHKITAT